MTEAKEYPRIWEREGERKIIGETKVSWLVQNEMRWAPAIKVPKRDWNRGRSPQHPRWFDSEESRADYVWMMKNRYDIGRRIEYGGDFPAATLRKIAELIGYVEENKQ